MHEILDIIDSGSGDIDFGAGYVGVGVDEGIEEAAIAGIQFGISTSTPEDFGGWGVSIDLTADAALGLTIGVTGSISSVQVTGAYVTVDGGEGAGLEIQESYTFLLADMKYTIPAMYQPRKKYMAILYSLVCNETSEKWENDEVYMTFKPDDGATYPYPSWDYYSMDDNSDEDTWYLGRSVWFDEKIEITLWDADDLSDDDVIAKTTINISDNTIQDLLENHPANTGQSSYTLKDDGDYTLWVGMMCPPQREALS